MDTARTYWMLLVLCTLLSLIVAPRTAVGDISGTTSQASELTGDKTSLPSPPTMTNRHYDILRSYLEQDTECGIADIISAGRSAWALGLVDRARRIWEDLISNHALDVADRNTINLSRSILELQEGNYELARAIAEQGANNLAASDLRAQFWLVVAESFKEQGILNRAESYYQKAVTESNDATKEEALFLLGESQLLLGELSTARYSFTSIPTSSLYAARALKRLIELDFRQQDYDGVITWISEGQESYPTLFDDPWTLYAQITSLAEIGRTDKAQQALKRFQARHAANNSWVTLAEAALETRIAQDFQKQARPIPGSPKKEELVP